MSNTSVHPVDAARVQGFGPNQTFTQLHNYGKQLLYCAEYHAAIGILTQAINTPMLAPAIKVDAFADRSNALYALKRHDRALADINHAIQLKPDQASYYADRAYCYQQMGQHDNALTDLTRAIELDSTQIYWWIRRAEIYAASSQTHLAIYNYQQAQELNSASMDCRFFYDHLIQKGLQQLGQPLPPRG
ncbi:MAG: tetratricopeptide repeat protein [Gammaproteobacteria bacterium]|nr:tetratricopeptide repeat protein [Gammaproteobacteria bacterium]